MPGMEYSADEIMKLNASSAVVGSEISGGDEVSEMRM